ncbi:MAG: hypothetical protein H6934_09300 [Burkholderiaceae bacterium]|nr:hypothetical protein [Burkholderiaceae bacterium]
MRSASGQAIILYIDARGLTAIDSCETRTAVLASFDLHAPDGSVAVDAAAAAFAAWIAAHRRARYELLVDLVDEEQHVEKVPRVRPRDRALLLRKRLAQRMRDSEFSSWRPLSPAETTRKRKRKRESTVEVLLTGLRASATLAPWLDVMLEAGARIDAILTPALLSPSLVEMLAPAATGLVVNVTEAGLRQSLVVGGRLRFSRLAALGADRSASAVVAEVTRTLQYLLMAQMLHRDAIRDTHFSVWIIDAGIDDAEKFPASLSVDAAVSALVWRVPPAAVAPGFEPDQAAPTVWASRRLRSRRDIGYANARVSRFEKLARWRLGMLSTGAAALACALLSVAGVEFLRWQGQDAIERRIAAGDREKAAQGVLAEALKVFVLPPPEMQTVVTLADRIARRHVPVDQLFSVLGAAIGDDERLRVDALEWRVEGGGGSATDGGGPPPVSGAPVGPPKGPPPPGAESASGTAIPGAPAAEPPIESPWTQVVIGGSLQHDLSKTDSNTLVDALVDRLRTRCGCEVAAKRFPFDPKPSAGWSEALAGSPMRRPREFRIDMRWRTKPVPIATAPELAR